MHIRPHILVVDDEPQITRVLRTSLNAQGYEIRVANDGETARSTASTRANYPSDGNQQTISKQSANNQQTISKESSKKISKEIKESAKHPAGVGDGAHGSLS